jgi:hypothetical protein
MANVVWYEDTNNEGNTGWKIIEIQESDKLIGWNEYGREYDEVFEA